MTERLTASQYRTGQVAKKPSKYRNKPVIVDNIRFASKREAAYYGELKMREKAGEVHDVQLQRRYVLAAQNGMLISVYVADFVYHDAVQNKTRVIDVKGFMTREFVMKRRMMLAFHGIDVEIVK